MKTGTVASRKKSLFHCRTILLPSHPKTEHKTAATGKVELPRAHLPFLLIALNFSLITHITQQCCWFIIFRIQGYLNNMATWSLFQPHQTNTNIGTNNIVAKSRQMTTTTATTAPAYSTKDITPHFFLFQPSRGRLTLLTSNPPDLCFTNVDGENANQVIKSMPIETSKTITWYQCDKDPAIDSTVFHSIILSSSFATDHTNNPYFPNK